LKFFSLQSAFVFHIQVQVVALSSYEEKEELFKQQVGVYEMLVVKSMFIAGFVGIMSKRFFL
jgi:hypothetical protein